MKLKNLFTCLTFLAFIGSQSVWSSNTDTKSCNRKYDVSKYFYKINKCSEEGVVLSISEFFVETDNLASSTFIDSLGRKTKRVSYASNGDYNIRIFDYTPDSVIETQYEKNSELIIKDKVEKDLASLKKITDWNYDQGVVKWIDRFQVPNEKQIISREFIADQLTYYFEYKASSRYGDEVESFRIVNSSGQEIGSYQYSFDGDITSLLKKQFSGVELVQKINQFENLNRESIGVIDSGFDLYHPSISAFLVNNPLERWGDTDHDGNGLAGDVFGWSDNSLTGQSGNINETVIIGGFKPFPLSHGTHVASIALRDQLEFSLLGLAGDVGNYKYLDTISKLIFEKKLSMVNMSWGFKEQGYPQTPPLETYNSLKKLIVKNNETLFFVAAGNNGWDLEGELKDYPASYSYRNTIVIGALNVSNYEWQEGSNLIPAIFKNGLGSNYGRKSVDIFAPGKEVSGARLGGGEIPMSGTSMASPFAMNSAMEARKFLPNLSAIELKELILKTAGHPEVPLDCVSRGFVNPKRISTAAKLILANPSLSIEEAALTSYEELDNFYPGERKLGASELRKIWVEIDKSLLINEE